MYTYSVLPFTERAGSAAVEALIWRLAPSSIVEFQPVDSLRYLYQTPLTLLMSECDAARCSTDCKLPR